MSEAETEALRQTQVAAFVSYLASYYGFEDTKGAEKIKAWTEELVATGELASVDWDALREEAHAHQMEREFGELYEQYKKFSGD